jgi:hypothetical protein
MFTRKPSLRLSEFLMPSAKRLLQHHLFKNGHRQCGYWSRSSRKCPLAIAPRQFTADHFFIFKAAPSKVVTMACISPSLVM